MIVSQAGTLHKYSGLYVYGYPVLHTEYKFYKTVLRLCLSAVTSVDPPNAGLVECKVERANVLTSVPCLS